MYVDIDFDQPRRLHFNLNAIFDLERVLGGRGVGYVLPELTAMNVGVLLATLWAGLRHEERHLDLVGVRQRLQRYLNAGGTIAPLFTAAYKALNESPVFRDAEPPPALPPPSVEEPPLAIPPPETPARPRRRRAANAVTDQSPRSDDAKPVVN